MERGRVVIPNALMLGEVSRLIDEGHKVVIMTKGSSMYPFIRGGVDSVRLESITDPRVGDIVLAEIAPGHYVLHRIFSLGSDGAVILKGDGNLVGIESCAVGDLRGIATHVIAPDGKETYTKTPAYERRSRRWRNAPYIVRRFFLAIYRRVI